MADIHLDLVVPDLKQNLGFMALDPVKLFLGASLSDVCAPFLEGPVRQETRFGSHRVEVLPLCIPPGIGISHRINTLNGDLGLRNAEGHFVLCVPNTIQPALHTQLADDIRQGVVLGPHQAGPTSSEYAVLTRAGWSRTIPVGSFTFGVAIR